MATTLYDKYGGFAQLNRFVIAFYDALLDSEEIGPYFDEVDLEQLIDHQTKFVSGLLGGPASFTDEHLRRAHARLVEGEERLHLEPRRAVPRPVEHLDAQGNVVGGEGPAA